MAQARMALALRCTTRVAPEEVVPGGAFACWLRSPTPRWFMQTGERTIVASGVQAAITAGGPTRFQDLRRAAQALWAEVEVEADMEVPREAGPLLVGGYAFDGGPVAAPWQIPVALPASGRPASPSPWPAAWLFLPGEQTVWLEGKAYRTVTQGVSPLPSGPAGAPVGGDAPPIRRAASQEGHTVPSWWVAGVASVLESIRRGEMQKVVLARTHRQVLADSERQDTDTGAGASGKPAQGQPFMVRAGERGFQPGHKAVDAAVARLMQPSEGAPAGGIGTTQFAFDVGVHAFIGSTPERLVRLHDGDVATHALAGTSEAGGPLLGRGKETREHVLVADAVRAGLERLGVRLHPAPAPHIKGAGNLQHLETPITGRAPPGLHVLDAVAALHPTPAVAGTPRDGALRMIADIEPEPRGWYAGGIGCVDRFGEGEFAVAIRSALLDGGMATLYAGAGVVEGSDAAAEWRETEAKLQAMRQVLA